MCSNYYDSVELHCDFKVCVEQVNDCHQNVKSKL